MPSKNETGRTALLILNYNNVEDTMECVRSVRRWNTAPVAFVLVDNGSTRPDAVEKLDAFLAGEFGPGYRRVSDTDRPAASAEDAGTFRLPDALLIASPTNDGYARGNNKALPWIEADASISRVMVLNNDILFTEDILPRLIAQADCRRDCAVICPALKKPDSDEFDHNCARRRVKVGQLIANNFFHYLYRLTGRTDEDAMRSRYILLDHKDEIARGEVIEIELPSGSCMLMDKALFCGMGGFDPHTFLYYEEDILHKRFEERGLRCYVDTSLSCIHLGAATTDKSPGEFLIRCNREAQRYWVCHYSGASAPIRWLHGVSLRFHAFTASLQKRLGVKMRR